VKDKGVDFSNASARHSASLPSFLHAFSASGLISRGQQKLQKNARIVAGPNDSMPRVLLRNHVSFAESPRGPAL
jgi:hypothetical protein